MDTPDCAGFNSVLPAAWVAIRYLMEDEVDRWKYHCLFRLRSISTDPIPLRSPILMSFLIMTENLLLSPMLVYRVIVPLSPRSTIKWVIVLTRSRVVTLNSWQRAACPRPRRPRRQRRSTRDRGRDTSAAAASSLNFYCVKVAAFMVNSRLRATSTARSCPNRRPNPRSVRRGSIDDVLTYPVLREFSVDIDFLAKQPQPRPQ
ncbi:hypothetical protein EVAR_9058_1 [Eumeta japonica]|uniref:Uncharacterized protein n=1 Tax=Eumeta variegata TaxID=151549 RepID=A0A4C1TX39_EUMVA|nr:hypothetical protein EVAR_9058_1 [Eumeta japonica]